MVTSFGDLHISGVGGRETHPWRVVIGDVGGPAGDLHERSLPVTLLIEKTVEK
jgi:hypothetical protein